MARGVGNNMACFFFRFRPSLEFSMQVKSYPGASLSRMGGCQTLLPLWERDGMDSG